MGIKENFSQAVKELAGSGRKDADKKSLPVEELKKAVEEDNAQQRAREITLNGGGDSGTTPVAEAFFAGEEIPPSPFARPFVQPFSQIPEPVRETSAAGFGTGASADAGGFGAGASADAGGFGAGANANAGGFGAGANADAGGFGAGANAGVPESGGALYPSANIRSARGSEDNEITIISRNTVIDGNIRSFADMSVDGDIKGDVETTKNIDLNGKSSGTSPATTRLCICRRYRATSA
ncbi:MAG: hypothetical protein LBI38_05225 [Oscillospiraceae bacterium]|jgi:hypothetical protein|nr:hypothetical protein [Oscillospiraceae bacterium]